MTFLFRLQTFLIAAAAIGVFWIAIEPALAQSPAPLPTAPGADRTLGTGPATAAKASLPGDNGSPLEPYLFTFLLAGGGIICAIAVRLADSRARGDYASFKR